MSETMNVVTSDVSETAAVAMSMATETVQETEPKPEVMEAQKRINAFMTLSLTFLDTRCPKGTGVAVSRAEVAKAGGLSEDNDALISDLISAGFMPGWRIRQGRDGGVCRVGEEPTKGPNPNKYSETWLAQLQTVLNQHVSLNPKIATPRNTIAKELAKLTGEEAIELPNKISEAISMGKCPGFESKRGAGILRKETKAKAEEALVVSSDATDVDSDETKKETETVEAAPAPVETAPEATAPEAAPETAPEAPKAKGGRKNRK